MAILKKLTLIKSVASNRFGALMSSRIFSSVTVSDAFNSSISVGDNEKNADSAADTKAINTSNTRIDRIASKMLIEKVLITIPASGKVLMNVIL